MGCPRAARTLRGGWLLLAVALLAVACTPGAYPIDIFPEMHYAPAQRRLEPNRLAVPPGAVLSLRKSSCRGASTERCSRMRFS